MLRELRSVSTWDLVVIGGGASGLGTAVDAASRGYRVALVERYDFAKGTSSRSTKLVHGGVRYLEQGNVGLVVEALRERGRLLRNAPHLVRDVPFVVPSYSWWHRPYYGLGLKVYDLLAGPYGFGGSRFLSRQQALAEVPTLEPEGLRGAVVYRDGQFDDARLAVHLARTAVEHGAVLLNYAQAVALEKDGAGRTCGVRVTDSESGEVFSLRAKVVVNATGAWTDSVRRLDESTAVSMVRPSQGIHVVLDKSFLPSESAILVPKTDDGRVLFVIPWSEAVVVGTTDTPIEDVPVEPKARPDEIDFVLEHARQYLTKDPDLDDVKSIYAGVRPLVSNQPGQTKSLARNHVITVSDSGLVTLTGGKWTTYRKMAEDAVDRAARVGGLPKAPCRTAELRLHGHDPNAAVWGRLGVHGSDARHIENACRKDPRERQRIHPELAVLRAQVRFAARHEMARTVEDVLSRRTRALLHDARAAAAAAPAVAEILAEELDRSPAWVREQIEGFGRLARHHLPTPVAAAA